MMARIKEHTFGAAGWMETSIGEVRVALRSDAPWLAGEFARLYPNCRPVSTPVDGAIRMEVREAGRSRLGRRLYRTFGDDEEIAGPRTRIEIFPFLEWGINLRVIARCSQYLQLHAASLSCAGAGCVLAGGSGCGKSTLAAGLLARGWNYLCDEFALIGRDTLSLHAFPKALCIKAGSFQTVEELGLRWSGRQHYIKGLKGRVGYIKPAAPAAIIKETPAPIRFVLFPKYAPGAKPRLSRLSRGRAFLELAGCTFNRGHFENDGLPVLAEVIRRAECYHLETGDLRETCRVIESELGVSPATGAISGGDRQRAPAAALRADSTSPALPTRREALRFGTRLAYIVPTVMTFSAQQAFAQASNPSGICSTGVQTGGLCSTDSDCCSGSCNLGICD